MKSNCECVKSIEEVVDHIRSLLGGSKLVECDGSYVLKPSNNEELCKAVSAIIEGGASVSPLSRKGTHTEGDFLVDMSDMAGILELDAENMTVKVQAGCKISAIMNAAEAEGLTMGVIPAGADPTVEDWVYSEAPGIGSYKYGTVKDTVENIIAVAADGSLLETGYDDIGYYMSGYNMIQTLAASSGRLAIISEVTFKLYPKGVVKAVAYEFPAVDKMQKVFQTVAQSPSLKPRGVRRPGPGGAGRHHGRRRRHQAGPGRRRRAVRRHLHRSLRLPRLAHHVHPPEEHGRLRLRLRRNRRVHHRR